MGEIWGGGWWFFGVNNFKGVILYLFDDRRNDSKWRG